MTEQQITELRRATGIDSPVLTPAVAVVERATFLRILEERQALLMAAQEALIDFSEETWQKTRAAVELAEAPLPTT